MAVTATPIFPQTIKDYVIQILPADTTTLKTVCAGATNGTKIESIIVTSTDTSARDVTLYKTISAVDYALCCITIPITAGTINGTASIDILRNINIPGTAFDPNGNKYIYIASGTTLKIASGTTVTAAKVINVVASGGDF